MLDAPFGRFHHFTGEGLSGKRPWAREPDASNRLRKNGYAKSRPVGICRESESLPCREIPILSGSQPKERASLRYDFLLLPGQAYPESVEVKGVRGMVVPTCRDSVACHDRLRSCVRELAQRGTKKPAWLRAFSHSVAPGIGRRPIRAQSSFQNRSSSTA